MAMDPEARRLWTEGSKRQADGKVAEAEGLYRRALERQPGSADISTDLAALISETGREREALALLDEALAQQPLSVRAHAQRDRLRYVTRRAADPVAQAEVREMHARLAAMNRELGRKPIYSPGAFWEHYGRLHVYLLERYGIGTFKRTVAHNYQNWLMISPDDPQVRRLFDLWATHLSSQPLRNACELPDDVGFHTSPLLPYYALADRGAFDVYRMSVGLLWEYTLAGDGHGLLRSLEESPIGNPVRILREGKLISSDLAHSVRERNELIDQARLRPDAGLVIGELGAGQGRLAELFGRTTNYRYFIFDIAPTLYVSEWYVRRLFPGERVFGFRPFERYEDIRQELAGARFAFFTANQIELLPAGCVDAFININSLMEMAGAQIQNFLAQIDRLTRRWLYLQQWHHWKNELDGVEVTKDSFRPPGRWDVAYESTNEVYPDFFVQLWKKPG